MERITQKRARFLMLLLCIVVIFYAFKLYDLQIIETGGNTNNISTFETRTRVKAPRGNILDTNGNVMVTNRASYDLVVNHYVLTSSATPNETLYQLVQLCKQQESSIQTGSPSPKLSPMNIRFRTTTLPGKAISKPF